MTTPHPHAKLMLEYAQDMAKDQDIVWQTRAARQNFNWVDVKREPILWNANQEYRRKPVPRPDYKMYGYVYYKTDPHGRYINVIVTVDGETGEPKSVELVK